MDSGSPKQDKEMVEVPPQKEETQEVERVIAPQNTLLNLAKLNIGTPRFEVNSAANEENAEDNRNSAGNEGENGVSENVQEEEVDVSEEEGEEGGVMGEGNTSESQGPREEQTVGESEGVINGTSKVEEEKEIFEVPEDELMRITGEDEAAKSVGGGQEESQREKTEVIVQEETVNVPQTEEVRVSIQEEEGSDNRIMEETPVEQPKEETQDEPKVDTVPEVQETTEIIQEEVKETEEAGVEEQPKSIHEEVVQVHSKPVEIEEEETPKERGSDSCDAEQQEEEKVQGEESVSEVVPQSEPELVVEVKSDSEKESVNEQSEVQEEEKPETQQPRIIQEAPKSEPDVVEEKVDKKSEVDESEKEEENLEMAQPCVMPPPPSKPQIKLAAPKKNSNKIEEEKPEAAKPILVRNQEISEDEKEMNFDTTGTNKVYAWGSAECDQFECPQYESRRPVEIPFFSSNRVNVSKIVCGSQHTLLLDSSGKVYSWGNSDDGVLGRDIDGKSSEAVPGLVDLDSQVDLISAGDAHSVFANSQTGELFFSGVIKSSKGKLSRVIEVPESITINKFKKSGIKSILSGSNHVLVHSRFNVYAFGDNSCGALGYILRTYDEENHCLQPHALRLKGIARVFTGAYHSFAITNKGILKTWGLNSQGQLGLPYYFENGEDSDVNHEDPNRNPNVLQLPHQVGGIDGNKIVDIVGGEHHSLMLMDDGSVWGAGRNDDGQLGGLVKPPRESYEEIRVPNSRVRVAGTNNYVMVTDDYMPNAFMRLPVNKSFQEIQSRSHYNYAINRVESAWPKIYSWGSGFNYVLGNGNEDPLSTPFRISNQKLFKGNVPNQVALGFSHVVYFTGDSHDVVLEEPKPRNTRKRDQMTPIKRKERFKGKRVKSK